MYFEEKIIDGILHYRHALNAKFTPYTLQEISMKYMELKRMQLEGLRSGGAF